MGPKPTCCELNYYATKESLKNYVLSVKRLSLNPLFKSNHILKLKGKILIENKLFINKSFNLLPPIFNSCFTFCYDVHNYQTFSSSSDKIFKLLSRTDFYGKKSITIEAINC